jgi:hypothetical protein
MLQPLCASIEPGGVGIAPPSVESCGSDPGTAAGVTVTSTVSDAAAGNQATPS